MLIFFVCPLFAFDKESITRDDAPLRGNLSQPFLPRILHLHVRIKSLCYGMRDECLPLFVQQFDEAGPLRDKSIYRRCLTVQEVRDRALLIERWNQRRKIPNELPVRSRHLASVC